MKHMLGLVTVASTLLFCGIADAQGSFSAVAEKAKAGNRRAEWELGSMYDRGDGVARNPKLAFCWTRRSAEHGDPLAFVSLGMMYGMGDGVAKDYIESYKWLYLETDFAPNWSAEVKSYAVTDSALIAKHMTFAQIDEAKKRADVWFSKFKARANTIPNC